MSIELRPIDKDLPGHYVVLEDDEAAGDVELMLDGTWQPDVTQGNGPPGPKYDTLADAVGYCVRKSSPEFRVTETYYEPPVDLGPPRVEALIAYLQEHLGPEYTVTDMFPPSDIAIIRPDETVILAAASFNRRDGGWEAVRQTEDEDQVPLPDGPLANGTTTIDTARWLVLLAYGLLTEEHVA